MVRGISAASIVPTASDDHGHGIPTHPAVSDEEEGGQYSSDEEDGGPPSPVAELQSPNYLQAAFNGQTQPNSEDPNSAIPRDPPDGSTGSSTISTNAPGGDQQPKPAQQKAVAPLIGKTLRQRSQSAVVQKQNGVVLTKNYLELVRDFRQLRPFTRRPDGKYPQDTRCVYCASARPTSVFFPCQHMCVCNDCIELNHISTDYTSSTDWCACPVCMADIRLILPHSGKEEEKYWKWVLEIKPSLPSQFKQDFREAGKRLNKNATPTRGRRSSLVTLFRRESPPQEEAPKDPPPTKPKVPVLGRRHSWQPGEIADDHNVAASDAQEEAHNCTIL